jgi:3-dehydroquinate dehydratase/shikimate dehydrogenase
MSDMIYLIGYRGTGKTSVSEMLGKKMKKEVIHLDDEIEKKIGNIDRFVKTFGWSHFRDIETELLMQFSKEKNMILDCGGGIITREKNIKEMKKNGLSVWLKADARVISKRLRNDTKTRPSISGKKSAADEVAEVLDERIPSYRKAAAFEIETDNKTTVQVTDEIIKKLKDGSISKKTESKINGIEENKTEENHTIMTKICVSIGESSIDKAIKAIKSMDNEHDCDIIEIRADLIEGIDEAKLEAIFSHKTKEMILTCRPRSLGGTFEGTEKERIRIIKKAIMLGFDFIDIEIETDEKTIKELMAAATVEMTGRKNWSKTKIILSYHDFNGTPSLGKLESIYKKINDLSPDLVKIVTTAESINDCFTIFNLLDGKDNLVSHAMGERGKISRILGKKFGSKLIYVSTSDMIKTASGQLNLNEIQEYNIDEMNKDTKILGVIGEHAENSKSKFMHNHNFKRLDLDMVYVPFKTRPEELMTFMKNFRIFGFLGGAVTVPHKEKIIGFIDDADETARKIGAVNTLFLRKGKIIGTNTDFFGAIEALKEKTVIKGKKVLLLGSGGAARAIAYGLLKEKADVTIANRTIEKAKQLADEFNAHIVSIDAAKENLQGFDIIINSTNVGMNPHPDQCILEDLPKRKLVMDIVYSPIQTKLIKLAKKRRCEVITGERMLIHQAIGQFEKWTGVKPDFKNMEAELSKHLGE